MASVRGASTCGRDINLMRRTAMRRLLMMLGSAGLTLAVIQPLPAQTRTQLRSKLALTRTAPVVTSGRYRIVALGAHVDQETTDGKRDEIYVAAGVQHVDRRDGRMISVGMARTGIMGDVNGFPTRIKAGSASSLGGVRTNDNVPAVPDVASLVAPASSSGLPLLVWEGELHDGIDVVIVQPEIWEWDGNPNKFNAWQGSTARPILGDPDIQNLINQQSLGPTYRLANYDLRDLGFLDMGSEDFPIGGLRGQNDHLSWKVNAIAVTREAVEKAIAAGSTIGGRPPATMEIMRSGYNQSIHYYRLYLRVERVP
jgi:hypothetical protein